MTEDRICSFMGLAFRARQALSGEFACEKAIKTNKARLVIVAKDASNNTQKKFRNSCEYYDVPFRTFADKELLGRYCGKEARAVVVVIGHSFAKSLIERIDGFKENHGGANFE